MPHVVMVTPLEAVDDQLGVKQDETTEYQQTQPQLNLKETKRSITYHPSLYATYCSVCVCVCVCVWCANPPKLTYSNIRAYVPQK